MLEYASYYVAVVVQLLTAYGFYLGGDWVFMGIASFPVFAVVDAVLPNDMAARKMNSHFWANVPVWICTLLAPALYLAAAWRVGQGTLDGLQIAGSIFSLAWLSVVPLVPSAHELYHQRGVLQRFVGRYAQVCYLDCTREIAHVIGHHIDVATGKDSDTARRGVSLYAFTLPAVIESSLAAWKVESDALEKRGKGRWSIGHRLYKAILAQVIFQTVVYLIGGIDAVLVALAAMMIARCWAECFNYFQHYGLVRVEGAPIAKRHVWNHMGWLTRRMGWEITNHADHHLDSYLPYYKLTPDMTAIRMPNVFICFLAALIPPVWTGMIVKPALKRWDLEFATAEERKLARAQNLAVGWPDWFDDATVAAGQAQPA
ncbi:alkane 1-monooxygenase [Acidocella aquatica]|uniref:Alkane 1-monooxygenase n=1 Tax=Acidocella aquatica TaxID=1922313 RepID=A0ABQ6A5C8_9PROT|nr:alkane 1-monooxygenase [Acidocella aquatica]GLR66863.1 alkane 1-monooxygenase [Acidocella aquatica]